MFKTARMALLAVLFAGLAGPLFAADLPEPQVEEAPPPVVEQPVDVGGWYIRGDLDYHKSTISGIDYMTYAVDPCNCSVTPGGKSFDFGKLKGGFSLGGGVGYKINNYLRTDVTADYWFKSNFSGGTSDLTSTSVEASKMSALLLLANAYVDIGTYGSVTPYVGAGIGGTYVKWSNLNNTSCADGDPTNCDDSVSHDGKGGWRFTYALMAGASIDVTCNLKADVGYRYRHINGGNMFGYAESGGPGYDKSISSHEGRVGMRYIFNGCDQQAYVPPAEIPMQPPVYK